MRTGRLLLAAGSLLLLTATHAPAAPTPAQRCASTKLLATFAEARARLACFQRRLAPAALAVCVTSSAERRDKRFAMADARGGCVATGDSADAGAEVAALVSNLLAVLPPVTSPSRCAAGQLGAAASALGGLGRAYARDARDPDPARLASALATAQGKFDTAFARALARGDCLGSATAAEAWAILAPGGARLSAKLVPTCGDGVRGAAEACDGSETGSCAGDCTAACTCADACGDGVVQAGEACDGSGCVAEDPDGCFPPGWGNECQCCAAESPCYVRGFGNVTPVEVPCCTGECHIPGPEAGPNVMVQCTEPLATACPCWTRALLDAAFPPGFFDERQRGGAVCDQPPTMASVAAADTCTLFGPGGLQSVFPRGGAGVIDGYCVLFADTDLDDNGTCDGTPPTVLSLTAEQQTACVAELLASQPYRAECP